MRNLHRLMLAAVLALSTVSTADACPGCKEATSAQGRNLARGFSYSILFMMPIPFIIVGSFGGYVYYTVKQRERELAASSKAKEASADKT